MSEPTAKVKPAKKERKRGGCLKKVAYFFAFLFCLFVVWLACNLRPVTKPGQPLMPVSVETTRLTEPLDKNGDVDYLKAINQQYSAGVTTENNAMVKFTQALGPLNDLPELNVEFSFCTPSTSRAQTYTQGIAYRDLKSLACGYALRPSGDHLLTLAKCKNVANMDGTLTRRPVPAGYYTLLLRY